MIVTPLVHDRDPTGSYLNLLTLPGPHSGVQLQIQDPNLNQLNKCHNKNMTSVHGLCTCAIIQHAHWQSVLFNLVPAISIVFTFGFQLQSLDMEKQLTSGCLPIGANAGQELSKPLEKRCWFRR